MEALLDVADFLQVKLNVASPASGRLPEPILIKSDAACMASPLKPLLSDKLDMTLAECSAAVREAGGEFFNYGKVLDVEGAFLLYTKAKVEKRCSMVPAKTSVCFEGFTPRKESGFYSVKTPTVNPVTEVAVQEMMNGVYERCSYAAGWKAAKEFVPSPELGIHDFLTVYQNGHHCAVAFAGTDSLDDVLQDIDADHTKGCGTSIHKGFWGELTEFTSSKQWKTEIAPFLNSSECDDGVIAVGHSLGGAMAEIFAACAAYKFPQGLQELQGPEAPTFKVKKVYTSGAPAISWIPGEKTQMTGADGACLDGIRFFNKDLGTHDPVPSIAVSYGFQHPKLKAIQFFHDEKKEYACDDNYTALAPVSPDMFASYSWPPDHLMSLYHSRADKLFR